MEQISLQYLSRFRLIESKLFRLNFNFEVDTGDRLATISQDNHDNICSIKLKCFTLRI